MTAVLDRARSLPGWARSALIAAVLVAVLSVTVTLTCSGAEETCPSTSMPMPVSDDATLSGG